MDNNKKDNENRIEENKEKSRMDEKNKGDPKISYPIDSRYGERRKTPKTKDIKETINNETNENIHEESETNMEDEETSIENREGIKISQKSKINTKEMKKNMTGEHQYGQPLPYKGGTWMKK